MSVHKCCCCVGLRAAAIVIGIWGYIAGPLNFVSGYGMPITWGNYAFLAAQYVGSTCLLYGAIKKVTGVITTYLILEMLSIIFMLVHIGLLGSEVGDIDRRYCHIKPGAYWTPPPGYCWQLLTPRVGVLVLWSIMATLCTYFWFAVLNYLKQATQEVTYPTTPAPGHLQGAACHI